MIIRSFDPEDLRKGTEMSRDMVPEDFDFKGWVENTNNVMLKDEDSIGFITYEYPGVYSPHHFHTTRKGKEALDVSREMLKFAFDNYPVEVLRGLTRVDLKAARWIARQLGCKSYGIVDADKDPHELFIMTKSEFYEHYNNRKKRINS